MTFFSARSRPALALLSIASLTLALAACSPDPGDAEGSSESSQLQAAETLETSQALSAPVQAQLDYLLTYWSDYNPEYESLEPNDCVNFASQSLLQRGWVQDDEWYYGETSVWDSSSAWLSSTSFNEYLGTRGDVVPLDDTQRDQVAVGDIVQFDWDNSGDRDHTAIVSRVESTAEGISIYFAGHTEDSDYRDVDEAITVDHPGGDVYYWHITEG